MPFLYIKKQDLLFLTKILIFFNLAYYMCGAEPAGNIPAPMLQQYIYKRKKRGKTNGKEKLSKIAALSLAAAMVLTTKFFL